MRHPIVKVPLQGIQSVETGLAVLSFMASRKSPMSLGDIARGTDLSPSQARRDLVSLSRAGAVQQDAVTGHYDLGPGALRIGLAALERVDAVELAAIALKKLIADTHESGILSIWGDHGPTIVRWFRAAHVAVTTLGLGTVFPLARSATGRIFLAYLPDSITTPLLKDEMGAAMFAREETQAELQGLKADIRAKGFSVIDGGFLRDLRGVSAPVFDAQGELVAALTLAGQQTQLPADAERDPAIIALLETARTVSAQLGYMPDAS